VLINAGGQEVAFTLPAAPGGVWELRLDTARPDLPPASAAVAAASASVPARGLLILSSAGAA